GVLWSAPLQLGGEEDRKQASDNDQFGDLDRRVGVRIWSAANQASVLSSRRGDRSRFGREPGAEQVRLFSNDSKGSRGRVLQPVRSERQRHELDGAADVWVGASSYAELSSGNTVAGRILCCRLGGPCKSQCSAGGD